MGGRSTKPVSRFRGGSLDLGAPETAPPPSTSSPTKLRRSAPTISPAARTFSVLVLGDHGAGKTALANALGKPFTDSEGRHCVRLVDAGLDLRIWEEGARDGSAKTFSKVQRDLYSKAEVVIVVVSLHKPDNAAEFQGYLRELLRHSTKSNDNQYIIVVGNKKDLAGPTWADGPDGAALLEGVYDHFCKMGGTPRCGWFVLSALTKDGLQMFSQALLNTLSNSQLSRDLMMSDPRPECPQCHLRCANAELTSRKAKSLPIKCAKCVTKEDKERKEAEDKARLLEAQQKMDEEIAREKAEKELYQLGITERLAVARYNSEHLSHGVKSL